MHKPKGEDTDHYRWTQSQASIRQLHAEFGLLPLLLRQAQVPGSPAKHHTTRYQSYPHQTIAVPSRDGFIHFHYGTGQLVLLTTMPTARQPFCDGPVRSPRAHLFNVTRHVREELLVRIGSGRDSDQRANVVSITSIHPFLETIRTRDSQGTNGTRLPLKPICSQLLCYIHVLSCQLTPRTEHAQRSTRQNVWAPPELAVGVELPCLTPVTHPGRTRGVVEPSLASFSAFSSGPCLDLTQAVCTSKKQPVRFCSWPHMLQTKRSFHVTLSERALSVASF